MRPKTNKGDDYENGSLEEPDYDYECILQGKESRCYCLSFKDETEAKTGTPSHIEEDKGGNSAKLLGKTMTEAVKMVENGAISFGKDPKNGSRLSFKLYIQSVF